MKPEPDLPADLAELLHALQRVGDKPANHEILELRDKIHEMAHHEMPRDDRLRLVMDSEDLTQDALLALVKGVCDFRGTTWAQFLAFVRRVLERKRVDLQRHHGRAKRRPAAEETLVEAVDPPGEGAATPSVLLSAEEDKEHMRDLIQRLPGTMKAAMNLRLSGTSYEAIATELGTSAVNARQLVSRALRQLREMW